MINNNITFRAEVDIEKGQNPFPNEKTLLLSSPEQSKCVVSRVSPKDTFESKAKKDKNNNLTHNTRAYRKACLAMLAVLTGGAGLKKATSSVASVNNKTEFINTHQYEQLDEIPLLGKSREEKIAKKEAKIKNFFAKDPSPIEHYDKIESDVKEWLYLRQKDIDITRYEHQVRAGKDTAEISDITGANKTIALISGTLHDNSKLLSVKEQTALAKYYGIEDDGISDNYIHGPVGAEIVKDRLGIQDPHIYTSIYCHSDPIKCVPNQSKTPAPDDYSASIGDAMDHIHIKEDNKVSVHTRKLLERVDAARNAQPLN